MSYASSSSGKNIIGSAILVNTDSSRYRVVGGINPFKTVSFGSIRQRYMLTEKPTERISPSHLRMNAQGSHGTSRCRHHHGHMPSTKNISIGEHLSLERKWVTFPQMISIGCFLDTSLSTHGLKQGIDRDPFPISVQSFVVSKSAWLLPGIWGSGASWIPLHVPQDSATCHR
jgi:hypothetical protein